MSEFPNTPEGRKGAAESGAAWSGDKAIIKLPDKQHAQKLKEAFSGMSSFAANGAPQIIAMAKGLELAGPALEIFNTFLGAWVGYFQGLVDWELVVNIFQRLQDIAKPLAELIATGVNAALEEFNKELEESKPLLEDTASAIADVNEELGPLIDSLRDLEDAVTDLTGTNMGAYRKLKEGRDPRGGRRRGSTGSDIVDRVIRYATRPGGL